MYQKGKDKTGGRKPGAKNKVNGAIRDRLNEFLEDNFNEFVTNYKTLPINEQIKTYRLCLQYILPRLNAVEMKQDQDQIGEIILTYHEGNHKLKEPENEN